MHTYAFDCVLHVQVGEDVIDVVSQLMGSGVTVLSSTSTRLEY